MRDVIRLVTDEIAPASQSLHKRLGMTHTCAAHRLGEQLSRATQPSNEAAHSDPSFSPAVMMVEDMQPQNAAETMIAAQLAALTPLMLLAVGEANQATTAQGRSLWTNDAVKVARTCALLADTYARMQRGGEQRVVIERVDVRDGGQAIVGAIGGNGAGVGRSMRGSTP